MKYKIINGSKEEIEEEATELLNNGWKECGGVSVVTFSEFEIGFAVGIEYIYVQAFIKCD